MQNDEHLLSKMQKDRLNGLGFILFMALLSLSEGSCKSSLFKTFTDRYLPDHVMTTVVVTSQFECSMLCAREDNCESWNLYETHSGLVCELNNGTELVENSLLKRDGAKFGHRLDIQVKEKTDQKQSSKTTTYTFTNLGAEGANGPTSTVDYSGTTLEGQVTLQNGIQEWRVSHTGNYTIESRGASGANGTCGVNDSVWQRGGLGAKLSGKFFLTEGVLLKILVGQRGAWSANFNDRPGGGGGGSFVTYANDTPLVIAGGGGGGGGCNVIAGMSDGDPGQMGTLGSRCNSAEGNGGMLCSNVPYTVEAGGGAGLLSNGARGAIPGASAQSFVSGGTGGIILSNCNGGFGGGGYGFISAGGGGGYSGGGVWANSTNGIAGGGGSVNNGFDRQSGLCDDLGHGLVQIVFLG